MDRWYELKCTTKHSSPSDATEDHKSAVPPGLSGHEIVFNTHDRCLYLIGGWMGESVDFDERKRYFREIRKFSFITNQWVDVPNKGNIAPPVSIASHSCHYAPNANQIWFYGGSLSGAPIPIPGGNDNQCRTFDIAQSEWQAPWPVTGTGPPLICGHWFGAATFIYKGYLYAAVGVLRMQLDTNDTMVQRMSNGIDGRGVTLVYRLDLGTKEWDEVIVSGSSATVNNDYPPEPGCRVRHKIIIFKDILYLFGGATDFMARPTYTFDQIWTLDLKSRKWALTTTEGSTNAVPGTSAFPDPRQGFGLWAVGVDESNQFLQRPSVYIAGGLGAQNRFRVVADMWKLDLQTLSWSNLSLSRSGSILLSPPNGWFFGTTLSEEDGLLFAQGGCTDSGYYDNRTNTVSVFRFGPGNLKCLSRTVVLDTLVRCRKSNEINENTEVQVMVSVAARTLGITTSELKTLMTL